MAAMREQEANERRFVFVQPRAEFEAKRPPQNPELSDRDRSVMTPFKPPRIRRTRCRTRGATRRSGSISRARRHRRSPPDAPARERQQRARARLAGARAAGLEQRQSDDPVLRGLRGPRPQAAVRATTAPGPAAACRTRCAT